MESEVDFLSFYYTADSTLLPGTKLELTNQDRLRKLTDSWQTIPVRTCQDYSRHVSATEHLTRIPHYFRAYGFRRFAASSATE